MESTLLKEKEAADYLRLAVTTLRRWRWSGTGLPFVKIGSAVRYELSALDDFIAAGRRSSTSERRAKQ